MRAVSAILFAVRDFTGLALFIGCAIFLAVAPVSSSGGTAQAPAPSTQQTSPQPAPTPPPAPGSPAAQLPPAQLPTPLPSGPMVVIDPAHGGTDSGARGPNGVFEKNIVLDYARTLRAEFERQGMRAVLTRNDDSNPSYDDRAGAANLYREVIFISLHVSSTGTANTARCYFDVLTPVSASTAPANALISWDEAQLGHLPASKRLAALIQLQLAQAFSGSPIQPADAPIRQLRSVEGPAVAVEISNVATSGPDVLAAEGAPLAFAIVRSVQAFRASGFN